MKNIQPLISNKLMDVDPKGFNKEYGRALWENIIRSNPNLKKIYFGKGEQNDSKN